MDLHCPRGTDFLKNHGDGGTGKLILPSYILKFKDNMLGFYQFFTKTKDKMFYHRYLAARKAFRRLTVEYRRGSDEKVLGKGGNISNISWGIINSFRGASAGSGSNIELNLDDETLKRA